MTVDEALSAAVHTGTTIGKATPAPLARSPTFKLDPTALRLLQGYISWHYQFANIGTAIIDDFIKHGVHVENYTAGQRIDIRDDELCWVMSGTVLVSFASPLRHSHHLEPGRLSQQGDFFPNRGPYTCLTGDMCYVAADTGEQVVLAHLNMDTVQLDYVAVFRNVFQFFAEERRLLYAGLDRFDKTPKLLNQLSTIRNPTAKVLETTLLNTGESLEVMDNKCLFLASGALTIMDSQGRIYGTLLAEASHLTELTRYLATYSAVRLSLLARCSGTNICSTSLAFENSHGQRPFLDSAIEKKLYALASRHLSATEQTHTTISTVASESEDTVAIQALSRLESFTWLDSRVVQHFTTKGQIVAVPSGHTFEQANLNTEATTALIISGSFQVRSSGGETVTVLEAGKYFGEWEGNMSTGNDEIVVAAIDSKILLITRSLMTELFADHPDLVTKFSQQIRLSYYRYRRVIDIGAEENHATIVKNRLLSLNLFKSMTDAADVWDKVIRQSIVAVYPVGALISAVGEETEQTLCIILNGRVNITSFIDNVDFVHRTLKSGDLFGQPLVADKRRKQKHSLFAASLKCEVLVIRKQAYQMLMAACSSDTITRITYQLERADIDSKVNMLRQQEWRAADEAAAKEDQRSLRAKATSRMQVWEMCMAFNIFEWCTLADCLSARLVCTEWSSFLRTRLNIPTLRLQSKNLSIQRLGFMMKASNKNIVSIVCAGAILSPSLVDLVGRSCPNLQHLDLQSAKVKGNLYAMIPVLMARLRRLRTVILPNRIDWSGQKTPFKGCGWQHLETLHVCGSSKPDSRAKLPDTLLLGSPILRYLKVSDMLISEQQLRGLTQHCNYLRHLIVPFCFLDDVALKMISSSFPNLIELDLTGSVDITEAGLLALSEGSHRYRRLNFSFIASVTDSAILKFSRTIERLEFIALRQCRRITTDALRHLALTATKLDKIDVSGCRAVARIARSLFPDHVTVISTVPPSKRGPLAAWIKLTDRYQVNETTRRRLK